MADLAAPKELSSEEHQKIRAAIRNKYTEVSQSAAGKFQYPTGLEGAQKLGYDQAILGTLSSDLLTSSCGVGNPFSISEIEPGSAILDIGCGAGLDLIVARRLSGDKGKVCGIDLTEEMIARARENLAKADIIDVEIKHVDADTIPYVDNTFDVIISNGVINLSPCKQKLFSEIFRALKPGGRLQFADIVLDKELPSHMAGSLEAWSQ